MVFTSQDAILVQKPYKFTVKLNGHQITTTKDYRTLNVCLFNCPRRKNIQTIQDAKKERKSEIEQNIWLLQVKMQFLSRNHINLQSS